MEMQDMISPDEAGEQKEAIDMLIRSIDMFSGKDYERLLAQVSGHRYFLGRKLGHDVSWQQAAYSWMEDVYLPISDAMATLVTSSSFAGKQRADVFFNLCDHWYFQSKDAGKPTDVFASTLDYDARYGSSIGRLLARLKGFGSDKDQKNQQKAC